jgi:hypothetical protein
VPENERVEKLKFAQTTKNRSERTHPLALDHFPKGGGQDLDRPHELGPSASMC